VGQPVPEVEVRIGPEGEVLCRGPNVMRGYFNQPEATAAALDGGGWLHTGDVGELDAEGFLRITDRLKDLIVLTNGKKVAPQPIESTLCTSPYLAQVVLMGDGQATVAALVVPAFERLADWARQQGMSLPEQREAIVATPEVAHLLRGEIDRLSVNLADFERVRGFTIMPGEFTVESGELTPTLKVRRRAVMANHADLIARMYAGG
jgi:long-chain acyl-CoA synthetase